MTAFHMQQNKKKISLTTSNETSHLPIGWLKMQAVFGRQKWDKARALEVQSAKVGLKINAIKSKLMHMGTKCGDGVSVAGEPIDEVDDFTYLGSIVSKKGGNDEDIQA